MTDETFISEKTGKKLCKHCNEVKPLAEFGKRTLSKDGYRTECKKCRPILDKQNGWLNSKESKARANRKYKEKNRFIYCSHAQVSKNIENGKIIKSPCSICGNEEVEAHHPDYNYPLNIMWLCELHHKAWHRVFVAERLTENMSYKESNRRKGITIGRKLTETDVIKIRELSNQGHTRASIARQFQITAMFVSEIARGKAWNKSSLTTERGEG